MEAEKKESLDVYFFSGLGADERLFKKLNLPSSINIIHVHWIKPVAGETIACYALRLSTAIDTSRRFALVGLSLGGMIVSELSKCMHPYKSVIISSASTSDAIPWYYQVAGKFRLPALVPMSLIRNPSFLTWWFAGTESKEEKDLVKSVLKKTDADFLKWSTQAICTWKNIVRSPGLFHIHGGIDRILPLRYNAPDYIINDGGHLMIYNRADEISRVLSQILIL